VGIDDARAHDGVSVGVLAPLADRSVGTTAWRVERWDAEQTAWAVRRLSDLGLGSYKFDEQHSLAISPAMFAKLDIRPYETTEFTGNLITTAGWTRLMNLLTNQSATQALTATAVRIGVGDATTPAEAYADTDLAAVAGSTHRWFQPVSGAGSLGTRTLAFTATFGTADGNYAWNEFGLDVGTPTVTASSTVNALLLNHKVGIAQGTKASGQTWSPTATLTFS
jgi:hypothetical protein